MLGWLRRHRYRRQVRLHIGVLLYPDAEGSIRRLLRDDVERWTSQGLARGWSPQTAAAVTMALRLVHVVRTELTLLQRERYVEQMRRLGPKDLVAELDWLTRLKGDAGEGMEPFVFRFTFMNCILASWLVRGASIDLFTKSLFVTAVSWALAGVAADEIHEEVAGLAARIGTSPQKGAA